ncbi:GntR family transcriptional regulator [Rhodoplanes sp. TEM]|uniref:GntR family transcriptional regulator n=1 Tax=Rhodoplanes tepidamans TaxID=200616 RepID=A0ABT5J6A3_RHOTP|nr:MULTISPECIES: GntR family transcriptional regulator [Rhodoplanes]MDC7785192.1 GntR family transcriptional regulator [Rhodoplanes tepidamans]MDC7987494.1 GntR family transcriptional regulator [Rhodoplanes sp. TEM]MDQ0353450.1 GntR family transcriptional regulator [Rhodoplanes tepidamans]
MTAAVELLKTRRLYLLLRDRIVTGAVGPGSRLPSEPALAQEHGVSRVTVRRALDLLAEEGLVRRRVGSGTFVEDPPASRPIVADFSNVLSNLIEMGRATAVKLLSFAYVAPPASIAEPLGLEPGERVQRSVRVRLIDGQPFSYLTTHVPERIGLTYSERDLATIPLLELMERSGIVAERATQSISATLVGPETAAALDLAPGSPVISLTRVVYEPSGRGVEHLHALYRPDRYAFQMDFVRTDVAGARRWTPTVVQASRTASSPRPSRPKRTASQKGTRP